MATEKGVLGEKSVEIQQVMCMCGLCEKKFDTSIKLRMHMFSHFPEFPSKCVYCQQNFTLRRDMVTHMEALHHMTLEDVVDYLEKLRLEQNTHETKEGGQNKLDKDSLQYSCNICGNRYSIREDLIQHVRQIHPQKEDFAHPLQSELNLNSSGNIQYNCKLCSVSFCQETALKQHIMLSHQFNGNLDKAQKTVDTTEGNELGHASNENCDTKNQYPDCDIGHKEFTYTWSSEKHLNVHRNSRYVCKMCSKSFSYKQQLQKHQKLEHAVMKHADTAYKNKETSLGIVHNQVKDDKCNEKVGTKFEEDHLDVFPTKVEDLYSCFDCSKTFYYKMALERHIESHLGIKLYTCLICRKTFFHSKALIKHSRIHVGNSVYKCNKCGESFAFHEDIKEHIAYDHGEKSVTCKFCRKVFTEEAFKDHIKMHKTENNRCKICGISFRRPDYLKRHMASHSDKRPHKCDICSKTFKCYNYLRDHISNHRKIFKQCHVCGKSVAPSSLPQHMIKHSDVKAFQCEVCSKFFKMKHQLKSHLLTHYDVREHECEICGFKFKLAHHLRSHLKVAHKT